MDERRPPTDETPRTVPHRAGRVALFVLGWIFLFVGVAGLVLPLVPGTVFLILAAGCFTRSSPRFEAWLLNHRHLGPPVRTWRVTGAIPRRAKWFAFASLAVSWLALFPTGTPAAVKLFCLVLFGGIAAYIGTRPDG